MKSPVGLSDLLRQARERAGFSQQEAADAFGVTRVVFSYWETGRRLPSLSQLQRLGQMYGLNLDALMGQVPMPDLIAERSFLPRGLGVEEPNARAEFNRWFGFLDAWAELLDEADLGSLLPGRGLPPVAAWGGDRPKTDTREAPKFALQVREHLSSKME